MPGPTGVTSKKRSLTSKQSTKIKHRRPVSIGKPRIKRNANVGKAAPRKIMNLGGDILAGFDWANAVIWMNEKSLNKMEKAKKSGKILNNSDIRTLSHEFTHVWQSMDVLNKFADIAKAGKPLTKETKQRISKDRTAKAQALVKKDTERISKMTEAQYIDFRLKQEKQAEFVALTVIAELKKSKQLKYFTGYDADVWIHNNRQNYVEGKHGFRAHYRKVREKLDKVKKAPSAKPAKAVSDVTKEALNRPKTKQLMKLVSSYSSIFPGKDKSITLFKLLKIMDRYDALIVVSTTLANPQ